jgi:hypothetical protein
MGSTTDQDLFPTISPFMSIAGDLPGSEVGQQDSLKG